MEQERDHRAEILSGSAPIDQRLGCGRNSGEGQMSFVWGTARRGDRANVGWRATSHWEAFWEAFMDPIEVRQVKEIILVSDDVHASRRLYREMLGLAMPATPDRLNLARVGSQYLGAAQAGVMVSPGLHRPCPPRPRDRRRRLRTRRRPPAAAGHRGHHPSPAAGVPGHARERGRLLPRSGREPDRALGSAARRGALSRTPANGTTLTEDASGVLEAHEVLVVRRAGSDREARLCQHVEPALVLGPLALRHEDAVGPEPIVALQSNAQHATR